MTKVAPIPISQIMNSGSEEIRVVIQEAKGAIVCDIRLFGKFSAAAVFMPTSKGISIPLTNIRPLIVALEEAELKARSFNHCFEPEG